MQQSFLQSKIAGLLSALVFIAGCSSPAKDQKPSPPGYDLNHPKIVKLSDKLNEISGLAYYPKDSSLFAIVDEVGVLFKIQLPDDKLKVQQWRFAKHSDYEDLVLLDSVFYAMKSKGDIIAFKFVTTDSVAADEYKIPVEGKNEFESLYYDTAIRKLVLICKDCEADNKSRVSTWAFDPASRSFTEGPYTIESAYIIKNEKTAKKKFKPSAAAIHPITGEVYIISSVNKVLVIADTKGNVKKVYPLDPDMYKQPEGIAFTPSGDMFISNEAGGEGLPNLLYFPYKKAVHEK
jgi:uncharacterized protein YjiK